MIGLQVLWREAANELAAWCCTSAALDYKKLERRIKNEGDSFLTITLPNFGKDFERSLEQGKVDTSIFHGFERERRGPLPKFLGGFLCQVFDPWSGQLMDDPNVDCIFAVRQLTLMFGKIHLRCSDARVDGAIERYIHCEQEIQEAAESTSADDHRVFSRVAALLFRDSFSELERLLEADARGDQLLRPKHGPGKTADRLDGNAKFDQSEWPRRWDGLFPFEEFALPYPIRSSNDDRMDRVDFLEPEAERPVRVITVPKTLKSPRIIAIEPTCMQYMQQALLEPIVEVLERNSPVGLFGSYKTLADKHGLISPVDVKTVNREYRHHHPSNFVAFSDQEPNRVLARLGSEYGHLATLDLSEASDRVSVRHVEDLLSRWPILREAVLAVRSSKADVPATKHRPKRTISLVKYASMGSALCFPMEAMVFLTTVFVGVERALGRPLTRQDLINLVGKVRVYGDDIIVPVEYVRHVIGALELFGFKVNTSKSFWNGKFRESCGGDYYNGTDVTPIRVRRMLPTSRADAEGVISLVELRNHMYLRGMWRTAGWLDKRIRKLLGNQYPIVEATSPVLGRISVPFRPMAEGWDAKRQVPLVKGYVVRSKPPASHVSGQGALLKYFLKRGSEPFADVKHLERQGRSGSVSIKTRWVQPW